MKTPHATRAAVEEGPAGGGVAPRAAEKVKLEKVDNDEKIGYNIVLRACSAPIMQIADNAGKDGGVVAEKVREGEGAFGFNALTGVYEDLIKAGVIDPTKVTRSALQNAASVASMISPATRTPDMPVAGGPPPERRNVVWLSIWNST